MSGDYRQRLLERYATAGPCEAPKSLDDLASREPWLRWLIANHFPADRQLEGIDVGCGFGALVHSAREAGYANFCGVDISAEQVDTARRLGIAGVTQGDAIETLASLPPASKDLVVSFDVLEHLHKDEVLSFVDAVLAVLRPGGRWLITVPNGCSPFFGRIRYGDFTHELAFTAGSLSQVLTSSGFGRVDCYEVGPMRGGARRTARWLVWKAIRALLGVYLAAESGERGRGVILTQNLLAVARR
ncbi:MAG: class I SAM-dependent methyltransferase [Myxococcota bacterium]|nr:class I SAM-dependent methyltransferase [Myxococcota bacterium]